MGKFSEATPISYGKRNFDTVILFVCISLRVQRYLFVNIPIECALVPIFIFGDN